MAQIALMVLCDTNILMESYALSHSLTIPDALIAATALDHDLSPYTLNIRDFRFIPELKLFRAS
jgi:predicted nucleic acid-binding protein